MKAIVVYGPNEYRFEEREITKPKAGEAVVKIVSEGVCATDREVIANEMVYYTMGLAKLPIVPGHEWSGEIVELGEGVTDFAIGDRVTGECTVSCGHCKMCTTGHINMCLNRTETGVMNRDGGYAQYVTFPVTHLHKFSKMSFDEAACVEPTGIATYAVMRGEVSPRDNVLIIGPGPIGLLAAQTAKNVFGAKRVLISGTREGRLARAEGYTDGRINVREEDLRERVMELTDGEGIDVVIETAGSADAFADAKKVLRPAGRVVICGFYGQKSVPCDWDFFCTSDAKIIGSLGSPAIWDFVIENIESGKIDIENIISHRLPMKTKEDFETAMAIVEERRENVCKIILHP